jgi:antitoxin (DNA-binding transcriptional repressor) of toxin-antitoxin stability system
MNVITHEELRGNVEEVLGRADAGEEFTVMVAGRPVAHLGPSKQRQWVGGPALRRVWDTPAPEDELETFSADGLDPLA